MAKTSGKFSNTSVLLFNFLLQPTGLRPFYGRDDKYFAQLFIVAREDVMKSFSITDNGDDTTHPPFLPCIHASQ